MSDPEPNPYAPPVSADKDSAPDRHALRDIVSGWERLRLLYNLVLLLPGVIVLILWNQRQQMPFGFGLVSAAMVAIGANIAFFLGPLAELYFRGLFRQGAPIGRGRWLIFGAGLVVSFGVFALALAGSFL
ncbi:MAG: hypothetical protein MUF31_16055 [Akkermansiaceae bacterium]|jgi:hypothetical protein|nr:hypothetical protein [Akkermansiaceae bacterium]